MTQQASLLDADVLVLDLETTGVNPDEDHIIQIACAHLTGDALEEHASFHSFVRPQVSVKPSAKGIHGWTRFDLEQAPSIRSVLTDFDSFASKEALLCGHNVSFDVNFLKAAYKATQLPFEFDYHTIDVWSLAYVYLRSRGIRATSYSLDELCEVFDLERSKHHDAMEDVRLTAAVLRNIFYSLRNTHQDISS